MSNTIWVQMTISISGGRADGRNWPDRWGAAIDLPASEALPLIRAGNAVEVNPPEAKRPLPPPASLTPAPRSEPAETAQGPAPAASPSGTAGTPSHVTTAPDAEPEPDAEAAPHVSIARENAAANDRAPSLGDLDPPKPADPKQAWVDYAMAHGETEDEANVQTKAGLMQKYGGRL